MVPRLIPIRRSGFQLLPGLACRDIQHPGGHQPFLAFVTIGSPDYTPRLDEFADTARLLRADRVAAFHGQLPVAECRVDAPDRLYVLKLVREQALNSVAPVRGFRIAGLIFEGQHRHRQPRRRSADFGGGSGSTGGQAGGDQPDRPAHPLGPACAAVQISGTGGRHPGHISARHRIFKAKAARN